MLIILQCHLWNLFTSCFHELGCYSVMKMYIEISPFQGGTQLNFHPDYEGLVKAAESNSLIHQTRYYV